MRCPFEECRRRTTLPSKSATHLIVAIDEDDGAFIHGPIEPEHKQLIKRMLMEVALLCQIDLQELAQEFERAVPESFRPAVTH